MTAAVTAASEPKIYSRIDKAFSFITLFLGYAMARTALFNEMGVGVTLYAIIFVTLSVLYMKSSGVKLTPSSAVPPAIMLVFSATFIVSGIGWVRLLTLVFEILTAVYWFLAAFGCRAEARLGDYTPFDMIKAFFVQPFASFFEQPKVAVSSLKSTKTGRNVFYIIIGLALAFVPAAIITFSLMGADDAFESLMDMLFDSFLSSVWQNLIYFIIGLPIAMYLFGMMFSASSRKCEGVLTVERCKNILKTTGFIPPAVIYTALSVILAIYALFFISQASYFLSAFASLLPDGYSYADYARKGFFELCRVSVINAVLVFFSEVFICRATKESSDKGSNKLLGLRIINILMGLSTLVLIAVAGAKLWLYIGSYGLTPARVNAAWFMFLLAFAAVFLVIRQLAPKFNFWRACTTAFIVLFALLAFSNTDALIAKYNIARFCDGSLPSVDANLFYSLSEVALPELAELVDRDEASGGMLLDEQLREECKEVLHTRIMWAEWREENSMSSLSDRINYLLGYNASRGAALKLIATGKYK